MDFPEEQNKESDNDVNAGNKLDTTNKTQEGDLLDGIFHVP